MKNIKTIIICSFAILSFGCSDDNNETTNNVTPNNGAQSNNGTSNNGMTTVTSNNGVAVDATCGDYCDSVTESCAGVDAQYGDREECIDYCENVSGWEPGKVGATEGNSVGCRLYHADVAGAMNPETHCDHAGPSGAGVCGSYCETYCGLMAKNCSDTFADEAACMTACGSYNSEGNPGDVKYDSVQCRIYHAGAPAAADGATHCAHAGEVPTDACVGQPTDFNFKTDAPSAYQRIDRMGMPAISTAVITDKDDYNLDSPSDDVTGKYAPQIVANLTGLHGALDDDLTAVALTPCSMNDMDANYCVGQAVFAGGPTVVELVLPDTLKIDPTADSGFPNGRKPADTVMDVLLAALLLDLSVHPVTALVGTNPKENDKGVEGAFLTTFPYLHAPHTP